MRMAMSGPPDDGLAPRRSGRTDRHGGRPQCSSHGAMAASNSCPLLPISYMATASPGAIPAADRPTSLRQFSISFDAPLIRLTWTPAEECCPQSGDQCSCAELVGSGRAPKCRDRCRTGRRLATMAEVMTLVALILAVVSLVGLCIRGDLFWASPKGRSAEPRTPG